ncbi:aspartyl-phosphate phosphatase Spo0E family protein [Bacillus sp. ISL-47]|uniref:aspartyl-phosphate phosphatase Spo0E family protein n=1 Tax=Bacillus sp. ISL-47 TaxID=2819130 RepID=UPI001BEA208F|nr:aspartyl-phosphate phosphatase Spo0E family protein [Bacillus sp. ISL-47]MBT2686859.1 aspartyl-phosphate phosphatase Spo0E family protein [Bacillus sp. ISL-47]
MLKEKIQEEREKLTLLIVRKRYEMIRSANSNGLLSKETIRCSQELDLLLNKFQLKTTH